MAVGNEAKHDEGHDDSEEQQAVTKIEEVRITLGQ